MNTILFILSDEWEPETVMDPIYLENKYYLLMDEYHKTVMYTIFYLLYLMNGNRKQ